MVKPNVDIIKTTLTNPSLKSGVGFLSRLKSYNVLRREHHVNIILRSSTGCFRQTVLHEWFEHSY